MNVKIRKGLQLYTKNMIVAIIAIIMLAAYLLMSPWQQFNPSAFAGLFSDGGFPGAAGQTAGGSGQSAPTSGGLQAPSGFQAPQGFQTPTSGQGTAQLPSGFDPSQLPQGFQPPANFDPSQLPQGGGFPGGAVGGLGAPGGQIRFLIPLAAVVGLVLAGGSAYRPRFNRLATGLTVVAGLAALAYFILFFVQDAIVPINLVDLATPGFWLALAGSLGLVLQIFIPRPRKVEADEGDVRDILKKKPKRTGLSVAQNIGVSIDALMANKLRSGLTMLGVIIGVASVVSLLSVGQGAQASITSQIEGTGLNQLTISPGASTGFGPPGGGGGGSTVQTLTYDDAKAIEKQVNQISYVLPQYSGSLRVRSDQTNYQATILGTVQDYAIARNISVEIGRFFSKAEVDNSTRVAVLGQQAAEELFGGLNPIGRDVRIDGTRYEVVGVLEEQDGGFGQDPNLQIYVPITSAYRNLFNARITGSSQNRVSSIIVVVENTDVVTEVSDDIKVVLRERHKLKADEDDDFNVLDQQSLLDTASSITGILTVLLGAIASISLLVGGIGIMNIMLVSVTERTKEIGLRKAIGARRSHILQQFLVETVFLSTLGGLLGVALGVAIALLVNGSGLINATITGDSIALGLGFSILVGVFFGVYPANQAAALQPIEALRYE